MPLYVFTSNLSLYRLPIPLSWHKQVKRACFAPRNHLNSFGMQKRCSVPYIILSGLLGQSFCEETTSSLSLMVESWDWSMYMYSWSERMVWTQYTEILSISPEQIPIVWTTISAARQRGNPKYVSKYDQREIIGFLIRIKNNQMGKRVFCY